MIHRKVGSCFSKRALLWSECKQSWPKVEVTALIYRITITYWPRVPTCIQLTDKNKMVVTQYRPCTITKTNNNPVYIYIYIYIYSNTEPANSMILTNLNLIHGFCYIILPPPEVFQKGYISLFDNLYLNCLSLQKILFMYVFCNNFLRDFLGEHYIKNFNCYQRWLTIVLLILYTFSLIEKQKKTYQPNMI